MLASWHVAVKWGTSHSSCRGKMGEVFQNPPISPVTMRVTGARVDRAQPDIPGDVFFYSYLMRKFNSMVDAVQFMDIFFVN